jgi:hypothetical protein
VADVKTNAFMLSSATLMIAPAFTTDVFSLTPADHSVGLVRDIAIPVESSQIELKNGIAQVIVDSKRSNVTTSISATIYEFSAQNLLYASGLYGSGPVQVKRGVLKTSVTGGPSATSLVINSDPVPGDADSAITAIGNIPSGSTILIQRVGGEQDYVFPTKSTANATAATDDYTVTIAAPYNIPTGMSFPAGSRVWIVTPIAVGSVDADDLYGVKITGTLSNYDRPVTAVFPKVRMTKGFNLSFTETEYGGMPWEMQPLLLSLTEASGRLADVGTRAPGRVFVGA